MRLVRRADNFTSFMCRLSWNLEASFSWKPQGLSRPVMGLLYLLPLLISVRGWANANSIVRQEVLCEWKNSSDTIGNQSRDLPRERTASINCATACLPFQMGCGGIVLPIGNLGARWFGWSTLLRGRLTSSNNPILMVLEARLVTGSVYPVASTWLIIDLDNIWALARMG
jgi:hypothetical protein